MSPIKSTATSAGEPISSEADILRENLIGLCTHMEYLRSWWAANEDNVRAMDSVAAYRIHDHFIEGAGFARNVVHNAGLPLIDREQIQRYDWTAPRWPTEPEVGPSVPYDYLGGNLGLGSDSVTIHVSTPAGKGDAELEPVLRNIDLFREPGRTQLLAIAAIHFGLPVSALMGSPS